VKRALLFFCILLLSTLNLFPQQKEFPKLTGPYLGQKPPGNTPEIFAPEVITVPVHSAVVFSPDGLEALCVPWSTLKMEMMKQVNGVWTKPRRVSFASEYDAENPCFTEDGSRMYFTSTRPIKTEGVNIKEKFWRENIWYVDRQKEGWSEPVPLNSDVNSFDIHWEISINDLNKDLYFSASSGEMGGGSDIYKSAYVDGRYTSPEKLSGVINTDGDEDTPFIASDGSYLIFARKPGANTFADLYISFRNANGRWGNAVNLGSTINSPSHEIYPVVTRDKKYLFFISMRLGKPQIYWVDAKIIEELRP
jgi:WD40-like Beta Propeller Repeat